MSKKSSTPRRLGRFNLKVTTQAAAATAIERISRATWGALVVATLVAFSLGLFLALVEARLVAQDSRIAKAVGEFQSGAMTLGFGTAMTGVFFVLARVHGMLRIGLGWTQQASGRSVHTLQTPVLNALSVVLSTGSTIGLALATGGYLVLGGRLLAVNLPKIAVDAWTQFLSAFRWFGVTTYLLGVAIGLAAVFKELRFQTIRLRELSDESPQTS